jgi:hypothetical protein
MPNNFISVCKRDDNIAKIEKAYKKMEIYTKSLADGVQRPKKTNLFFKMWFCSLRFYN